MDMIRVLVSSTYRDLKLERDCVRHVIEGLGKEYPVQWLGMEEFGALATTPLEASQQFTSAAELIVLLVGASYGSVPPDGCLSFTEEEYEIVRKLKLPCLAYVKSVDDFEVSSDAARFRGRLQSELTCQNFDDLESLERMCRKDLQRELDAARASPSVLELQREAPYLSDPESFKDREMDLAKLREAMTSESARFGVVGPTGIGKTTLVQQFFRRNRDQLLDPMWLRVDELFGRDTSGRLRVGSVRWTRERLARRVAKLLVKFPRSILVLDNVQAAPMDVGWLSSRLDSVCALFLSWDAAALPDVRYMSVRALPAADAHELLIHYCNEDQRCEADALARLDEILCGEPLLISLAGRRLRTTSLPVGEFVQRLQSSREELLNLQGPSVDREQVEMSALLRDVYHCLSDAERKALSTIARGSTFGISTETMRWACAEFGIQHLDRAVQLGLLEARHSADWRGYRYRLRSIVRDFLQGTDAATLAEDAYQRYLLTPQVLADSSGELVAAALRAQLACPAPGLPGRGGGLGPLLCKSTAYIRAQVLEVLRGIREPAQANSIVNAIAGILETPRPDDVTLDLINLLAALPCARAERELRRLWQRPIVQNPGEVEPMLDPDVGVAAGEALARLDQVPFHEWLMQRIGSRNVEEAKRAVDAASRKKLPEALPAVVSALDHNNASIRRAAADSLSFYDPDPNTANHLWRTASRDVDADVRSLAITTLGVWSDERALEPILKMLLSGDEDVSATAVSVLWRYRTRAVADRLAEHFQAESNAATLINIAFVLGDFHDPRAGDMALKLLRCPDRYSQKVGFHVAGFVADVVPRDERIGRELVTQIQGFLASEDLELRLLARAALVGFKDESALVGLWKDVSYQGSGATCPIERWHTIFNLAGTSGFLSRVPFVEIKRLLDDPDPKMRSAAALVAGQMRCPEFIPALENLLEDTSSNGLDKSISQVASEALDRIAGKRPPWKPHEWRPVVG